MVEMIVNERVIMKIPSKESALEGANNQYKLLRKDDKKDIEQLTQKRGNQLIVTSFPRAPPIAHPPRRPRQLFRRPSQFLQIWHPSRSFSPRLCGRISGSKDPLETPDMQCRLLLIFPPSSREFEPEYIMDRPYQLPVCSLSGRHIAIPTGYHVSQMCPLRRKVAKP